MVLSVLHFPVQCTQPGSAISSGMLPSHPSVPQLGSMAQTFAAKVWTNFKTCFFQNSLLCFQHRIWASVFWMKNPRFRSHKNRPSSNVSISSQHILGPCSLPPSSCFNYFIPRSPDPVSFTPSPRAAPHSF